MKKIKIDLQYNKFVDSYDNEGFVPDFINYNFEKDEKGVFSCDSITVYQDTR